MTTGATDSSFLRAKGVQAYGIGVPERKKMDAPFTAMTSAWRSNNWARSCNSCSRR